MNRRLANILLAMALTLLGSFAHSQTMPKVEPYGLDGFRLMLQQEGLETTQLTIGSALGNPAETVVVVIGDMDGVLPIYNQLTDFMRRGGSMLVASDIGGQRKSSPWLFGSQFRYDRIRASGALRYRGYYDCPIVNEFNPRYPSLFDGIETIVTNRPATIRFSPKFNWAASFHPSVTRSSTPRQLMGVWQEGEGRMLLVADHSIFINEMLIHGDNAHFASNVAKWLTEDGNRSRLVVIQDGKALGEWSLGGTPPAIPLETLLKVVNEAGLAGLPLIGEGWIPMVNQTLGEFERRRGFNELAQKFNRSFRIPIRNVSILLALFLVTLAACRLVFTRGRAQRWLFFQESKPTVETSVSAAFREKQYQPYLRALCREFFGEWGIAEFSTSTKCPTFKTNSSLRKGTTTDLQTLWNIATNTNRKKISKKTFLELVQKLRELHHLQVEGSIAIKGNA